MKTATLANLVYAAPTGPGRPLMPIRPLLSLALAASVLWAVQAKAQDVTVPGAEYYGGVESIYRGEYVRAEREFTSELRGAVKTVQARWIDSICYHAMLGETYYQRGQHRLALAQFDQACELALAYPNWLMRVEFRQEPRPDGNMARRLAPWGRSTRNPSYCILPETMLIGQGQINNNAVVQQGGVVQMAQLWRVNAVEILRATALAIRRRNELLGPLAAHDRLAKDLATTFARTDLAPRNHWSNSWTELLVGLAQAGIGETQQALTHLGRAVLLDGRYDHGLTGAALLAQARIALASGNVQAASGLLLEASYAGYAYEDFDVVAESMRLGHEAHVALANEGVYPPLAVASEWARRESFAHIASAAWIDQAESLALAGKAPLALAELAKVPARPRDVLAGRLGGKRHGVEALANFVAGKREAGDQAFNAAIDQVRAQSIRNLQIALANERFDGGDLSPRIAVDLYGSLLADPVAGDWALDPLDTLAHLKTDHEDAFGRWFLAAQGRKDVLLAATIADQTKRRRFWLALPMGGRLLGLRFVLEGDANSLPQVARLERQSLLTRYPAYNQLSQQAAKLRGDLAAQPLAEEGRVTAAATDAGKQLQKAVDQQETMLRAMALSRGSTTLVFPPTLTGAEMQQRLAPGQALLVFHRVGTTMHAMLLAREAYHPWRLPDTKALDQAVATALQGMGNFTQARTIDLDELASNAWRDAAGVLGKAIFADSRLDLGETHELTVVPDGVMWHVPIETLPITSSAGETTIAEHAAVRYAPTVGLALAYQVPSRPLQMIAVAVAGDSPSDTTTPQMVEQLLENIDNAVPIGPGSSLASPLIASVVDMAISLVDTPLDPASPYSFTPLPVDRTGDTGSLGRWMGLPLVGPERIVLSSVATAAETGLKTRRRSGSRATPESIPGSELFHASCGLMASGAQTVLLTRWRTDGRMHRDLITEFVREVPNMPAAEAWRRSVVLARSQPLDVDAEPRLRRPTGSGDTPAIDHPFMWAGYLLIDTGRPIGQAVEEVEAAEAKD